MWVSLRLMLALSLRWWQSRRGGRDTDSALCASLVGVGDVLSQVVDADARAPLVDHLRGVNHIRQLRAGDEALGKAQSQRRLFREVAQSFALGKPDRE